MDLQAEKLKLVQAVLNIDDIGLIKEVENLLETRHRDWFDDLNEDQQQSVLRGLEQAGRSRGEAWLMTFAIIWMPEALKIFEERIEYLNIHFTEKEIKKFKKRVSDYLEILKVEPRIGKVPGKLKNVHMGLIVKQVSVIYRVKTRSHEIELLSFIDNRQSPQKNLKNKI
jgi:plasmid stabilization system protein ParE